MSADAFIHSLRLPFFQRGGCFAPPRTRMSLSQSADRKHEFYDFSPLPQHSFYFIFIMRKYPWGAKLFTSIFRYADGRTNKILHRGVGCNTKIPDKSQFASRHKLSRGENLMKMKCIIDNMFVLTREGGELFDC